MGTGPFTFVEHVKGSHWVGKKNPDYWDKGKPYLDGYRALFISSSSAQVAAIRGERAHIQFRGFSPAERDSLVAGAGPEDHRAGEPLGLRAHGGDAPREEALRRQARAPRAHAGARPLRGLQERCRKIAIVKDVGGVQVPGTPYATPPGRAGEAGRLRARHQRARAEAKRLLQGGGRARRLRLHVQEPRHPAALRAAGHLAHRPVAADRPQREAGDRSRPPPTTRCSSAATSTSPWTSSAASSSSPTWTSSLPSATPTPTTASTRTR